MALLERQGNGDRWRCLGSSGADPADQPAAADVDAMLTDSLVLALRGRVLPAADRRVLEAFAGHAAIVLEHRQLAEEAARARKLAEANKIRTALLAAVSHDLRTPLAGVKAAVSSLRQTDVRLSEDDRAELLAGIEASADRLDSLVTNLLDMSRIQADAVRPLLREVRVDEVVPAALIGVPADAVKVTLPEGLPVVRVDTGLIERAVANVVENAVRHNPHGKPVLLTASAVRDRVEVRVVDRGPGVPDAVKDRIFEPFQRLGDAPGGERRRTRPRSRARLRRSRRRIPRGRRHPRRRPHHGARPPRARPYQRHPRRRTGGGGDVTTAEPPRRRGGDPPTRVLVVEDEQHLARALAINLEARDYEVDVARDGKSALDLAARRHPAIIVLDLGLPDIDGMDVIRGLRGWTQVPILVLSARHSSTEKVSALDAGADDYVTKPFGMDELLARLRAAIRRGQPGGAGDPVVATAAFTVDLAAKKVTRDGSEVRLTPTEWHLLETLVRSPNRLIGQRQLLQEVWGPGYVTETNYLRVYLAQLRRKLEPDPAHPRHLITEPGMGYRFEP